MKSDGRTYKAQFRNAEAVQREKTVEGDIAFKEAMLRARDLGLEKIVVGVRKTPCTDHARISPPGTAHIFTVSAISDA